MSRAQFLKLLAATAGGAALASCSTGPKNEATNQTTPAPAQDSFPLTIDTAFGPTTIDKAPTRVVCLGWINGDVCASLGVIPVLQAAITWGNNENNSNDWFDAAVTKLGAEQPQRYDETDGPDFTAIAAANPDVIINVIGAMDQQQFDKLSKIAPVVTYASDSGDWMTPWDRATTIIGSALGLDAKAKEVVDRVSGKMKQVGKNNPAIQGATFIPSALDPKDENPISLYAPDDVRSVFFEGIGMKRAPILKEADFSGGFYGSWSPERADELQSQFLYTWSTLENAHEVIKNDPLLGKIPAVAKDAFVADNNQRQALALGTSPLGIEWLIDETDFIDQVNAAAEKGTR
ncbi:hypothetical protein CAQU_11855 [Corynebacterium aquilae DSM 44791]|uniref:Fe/B12 periplasmic-binding domain-containing protein n=1 Tax=Corynebacterium aquilae DSM 44791 TaxID=1431546 RepID=A0A1L7CIH4_9CORY|nr:hypothetical protein CAQU_11855 [Corynebacterium aquilae DSM 44791]